MTAFLRPLLSLTISLIVLSLFAFSSMAQDKQVAAPSAAALAMELHSGDPYRIDEAVYYVIRDYSGDRTDQLRHGVDPLIADGLIAALDSQCDLNLAGYPGSDGSATIISNQPTCTDSRLQAFCTDSVSGQSCNSGGSGGGGGSGDDDEIIVTAPRPPGTQPTPPVNLPHGDGDSTNPVGGGDTTPSDSTGTGTDTTDSACMCNDKEVDQAVCDLVEEHKAKGSRWAYDCSHFSTNSSDFIVIGDGYEAKHNGYGLVSSGLTAFYGQAKSYLATRGTYPTKINSGYRCPEGNKALKKKYPKTSDDSRHQCGHAADIAPSDGTVWGEEFKRDIVAHMRSLKSTSLSHKTTGLNYVHIDTETCPFGTWSP